MIDITQKPYFAYNEIIDMLSAPLQNHANVRLGWFSRCFRNGERFLIVRDQKWAFDYFTNKSLYAHGYFEREIHNIPEGYHMWDHLPYSPPEVYGYFKEIGLSHGLTIVRKNEEYCDFFIFATHTGNHQVNNFYLNRKDLFASLMEDFYTSMETSLEDLSTHTFFVPVNIRRMGPSAITLSPRQLDCAKLLSVGCSTKEIASKLQITHWTVEEHISVMKAKFGAKNRFQLIGSLLKMHDL